MVKPNPRFLPWLKEELAEVVEEEIRAKSVTIHTGCRMTRIDNSGGHLQVVCEDLTLDADMVLVATGVLPNSEIAAAAGIELGPNNSIAVDNRLMTSDPHVYAAGDCADAVHVVTGQKTWIPLALRANRAGWAVADNVCGRDIALSGVVGTAVFKVFDLQVARTGLNRKEAAAAGFETAEVAIKTRSRAHAHPGASTIHVSMVGDTNTGRLLGTQMVGHEGVAHRINAPAVALHAQMTVEQFSQTDLSYAPPFGPTWDPCLTAANQLLKKL
jgi:NADPH-dependent 2,4-dienoyl-CoA reductase/sulfur reductase-like enzyme